ncbi:hypothetical protein K440DRAFT_249243 [Wilcoxina mikolae CBS 423.85]|nr:hypothetical protein K440DRAFT_249243 [Wilcoxina mikolae CBS 423.85]
MVPFTVSTGMAGLLSLTIEITKLLGGYISGVNEAPKQAQELLKEISALDAVLNQLVSFLRIDDAKKNLGNFDQTSVLQSVIAICQRDIQGIYQKLARLWVGDSNNRFQRLMDSAKWPFEQTECRQVIETLRSCVQTFHFSLTISNCVLLTKTAVSLQEDRQKVQGPLIL